MQVLGGEDRKIEALRQDAAKRVEEKQADKSEREEPEGKARV